MPYIAYPEGKGWVGDDRYAILQPYLESTKLRFSLGGMKGREADRLYRALSQRSIETQIAVARRLGFAGIYVDRTGYRDGGTRVIGTLTSALGADSATLRSDGRIAFFRLQGSANAMPVKAYSLPQIYALAQFDGALRKPPRAD
jgi:phosphoglycerol transferase